MVGGCGDRVGRCPALERDYVIIRRGSVDKTTLRLEDGNSSVRSLPRRAPWGNEEFAPLARRTLAGSAGRA